ncbi:MAG: hypothetical protein KY461_09185 [Actinobacteria bacterium]|nr:hypothetical protein [Actinomycetota bacterium]
MRRALPRLVSLCLAASLLALTPTDATDPCADSTGTVVYPQQQVWVHEGETKVGNLTQHGDQPPAPWDTEPPTASVATGAGAGALSGFGSLESLVADSPQSATFAGAFEGCLDTVLVELYAFQPTNRTGTSGELNEAPHNFGAELVIDGKTFTLAGPKEAATVPNPGGSATYRLRFAIHGVRAAMERHGLALDGPHELQLTMTAWFINTNNTVYVWDTTEVPTGLTFNGTADETYGRSIKL